VVYVSLHDADPGAAGKQDGNELVYDSYARVGVACNPSNWSVVNGVVRPVNAIVFPRKTGGINPTARWVSIGLEATGPGKVIARGPLTPQLVIANNIRPVIEAGSSIPFLTA
jgi:hypothetical protein